LVKGYVSRGKLDDITSPGLHFAPLRCPHPDKFAAVFRLREIHKIRAVLFLSPKYSRMTRQGADPIIKMINQETRDGVFGEIF
jgi:hypothetical protein